MDRMVFFATPARICIEMVSSTNLRYGDIKSEKILRSVVLPLACHDDLLCAGLPFTIRSPKASGPGLTVRIADNRTGARVYRIIGLETPKSSGTIAKSRAPFIAQPATAPFPKAQLMVGKT
jgi:hypothetical protein